MPKVLRQSPSKPAPKARAKTSSLQFNEFIDLEDIPDIGLKMGVYGMSGTGKTRFMGTFYKRGKILHMICSSNGVNEARSIRGVKGITLKQIQEPDDLRRCIDYALSNDIATVCLDHLTDFTDLVLSKIIGKPVPEQSSWGLATMQQYQQLGLQVKTYLREIVDIPLNVIINGQERVYNKSEDEDDIIMPYISIATTPSVAGWIAPTMDYFFQTFKRAKMETVERTVGAKKVMRSRPTGEVEYCLRVGPDPTYITKCRVPPDVTLPDVVVDPTYEKIKPLIDGDS